MAESVIKSPMAWTYLNTITLPKSSTPSMSLPTNFNELLVLIGFTENDTWLTIIPKTILSSTERVIRNGSLSAQMFGKVMVTSSSIKGEIYYNGSRQDGKLVVYYR